MKKLLLILIIAVVGCSSDDPSPKNFTSLKGSWRFVSGDASATFTVKYNESNQAIMTSGTFKLNGHSYTDDSPNSIITSNVCGNCLSIDLINSGGSNISFTDAQFSDDFKTITCNGYFYTDNGNYIEHLSEEIVINRK